MVIQFEGEVGLGGVDLDDGVEAGELQSKACPYFLHQGRLEAHGGEVELLRLRLDGGLEGGDEGVEDGELVAFDLALGGAVVDEAEVAVEAEGDGVVERELERAAGGGLNEYAAGARGGAGGGEDHAGTGGAGEGFGFFLEDGAGGRREIGGGRGRGEVGGLLGLELRDAKRHRAQGGEREDGCLKPSHSY